MRQRSTFCVVVGLGLLIPPMVASAQTNPVIPNPPIRPFDDLKGSGLPQGTSVTRLTTRQVFQLAVVRSRSPRDTPAIAWPGAEVLEKRAKEVGFDDFGRFKQEFQANPIGDQSLKLQDIAISYLDLLGRRAELQVCDRSIQAREGFLALLIELARGENTGVRPLDLDLFDQGLQRARLKQQVRVKEYQDRLDGFKFQLGLKVDAPVVLDVSPVSEILRVFEAFRDWQRKGNRKFEQLPALAVSIPGLDDRFDDASDPQATFQRIEALAAKRRGVALETLPEEVRLNLRRQLRGLSSDREAFELGRRELVLAIRQTNNLLELFISPNIESRTDAGLTRQLLESNADWSRIESALIQTWTRGTIARLTLERELGLPDVNDWNNFMNRFRAIATPLPVPPTTNAVPSPVSTNQR